MYDIEIHTWDILGLKDVPYLVQCWHEKMIGRISMLHYMHPTSWQLTNKVITKHQLHNEGNVYN